jgi:uncharacterized protein YggU (UPF0235/DUF167 family)
MYLKIKVVPDSRSETIEKKSENEWRICVKVPAENNAANTRVLDIIRQAYPNQSVRIVSGHHSPSKIVSIN